VYHGYPHIVPRGFFRIFFWGPPNIHFFHFSRQIKKFRNFSGKCPNSRNIDLFVKSLSIPPSPFSQRYDFKLNDHAQIFSWTPGNTSFTSKNWQKPEVSRGNPYMFGNRYATNKLNIPFTSLVSLLQSFGFRILNFDLVRPEMDLENFFRMWKNCPYLAQIFSTFLSSANDFLVVYTTLNLVFGIVQLPKMIKQLKDFFKKKTRTTFFLHTLLILLRSDNTTLRIQDNYVPATIL